MHDDRDSSEKAQPDLALSTLFAALVETLGEKSHGLARSFGARLAEATARLAQEPHADRDALATLALTRELLAEDLDRGDPACVIYAKPRRDEDALPSCEKVQLSTLDEAVRFWIRLPEFDRSLASVETANGHRLSAGEVAALAKRLRLRASL